MKPNALFILIPAVIIAVIAGLSSCRRSNGAPPQPAVNTDTVITDTTIFIDITLDGNRTLGILDPATSPTPWGNVWGAIDPDSNLFIYNRIGADFVQNTLKSLPAFTFTLGNLNLYSRIASGIYLILPAGTVDSFFASGNFPYSKYAGDTSFNEVGDTLTLFYRTLTRTKLSPGVNISWVDSAGTVWETLYNPAEQTDSYFTVTGVKLRNASIPGYVNIATVTANFACTLYDKQGHSIHLTNGRLRQAVFL
jgi:hypothetical protein